MTVWDRLGDPVFAEAFWAQVDRGERNVCWPWLGRRKPSGYGDFKQDGSSTTSSRVALALSLGRPLRRHEMACHRCDNPPCCNPAHLFVGTGRDNALDSVRKGRARRALGEACGAARLTEAQVREIRSFPYYYGLYSDLGRRYGVSRHAVRQAHLGHHWRHVA